MLTFLDSADTRQPCGRWSFLMADPVSTLRYDGGQLTLDDQPLHGDPWEQLRIFAEKGTFESDPEGFPFRGGVAGYIGYEMGETLEKFDPALPDEVPFPGLWMHLYDIVLAWDHHRGIARMFSSGLPEPDPVLRQKRARERLLFFRKKLAALPADHPPVLSKPPSWTGNFTGDSYRHSVERVRQFIRAGDIFQANLTQRFTSALPSDFDLTAYYLQLRRINPAPFAAWLRYGDRAIASASPERFLCVVDDRVETRPIKGTRPRSTDPTQDARLADELLCSGKDRAENTMIVDLLRNDLSRVCRPGSVRVPTLCGLESYANVHHLVSVVEGHLEVGRDGIDLLKACFPGGSITGAPKKRSMEIIRELEGLPRQVYCGAIGYLGCDGRMDLNIAIRTVLFHGQRAWFQVGGGITWRSDPDEEYRESLTKAERLFASFQP